MELFEITHIPMPVMGGLLFMLGLIAVRFTKHAVQRPQPPHWLRHDMACLLLGTAITLSLCLGLGFLLMGAAEALTGDTAALVELVVMALIAAGGWWVTKRLITVPRPAKT